MPRHVTLYPISGLKEIPPHQKRTWRPIPLSCTKLFLSPDKKLPKKMKWSEFVDDYDLERKNRGKIFGKRLHVDIPFIPVKSPALQALCEAGCPTVPRFDPLSATVETATGSEFEEDVMDAVASAVAPSPKTKAKSKPAANPFAEDVMDIEPPVTPKAKAKPKSTSAKKTASPSEDEPRANGSAKKTKKRKADDITPTTAETCTSPSDVIKTVLQKHPTISAELQPMMSQKHSQENLKKFAASEALVTETLSALLSAFRGKPEAKFVSPSILFRIVATAMMPIVNLIEAKIYQYMDQKSIRPLITTQDKQTAFFKQKDTIQFIKNLAHHIRLTLDTCAGILSTYAKFQSTSPMGVIALKQSKNEAGLGGTKTSLRIKELCTAMTKISYFHIVKPLSNPNKLRLVSRTPNRSLKPNLTLKS